MTLQFMVLSFCITYRARHRHPSRLLRLLCSTVLLRLLYLVRLSSITAARGPFLV